MWIRFGRSPGPDREGTAIHESVARLLKARTAAVHDRVEAHLDLLDPALSPGRLCAILARFAGFWSAIEASIDVWAQAVPDLADRLDWPRRRRTDLFRTDVIALGGSPTFPVAEQPFAAVDTAAVLGWLYVAEGSTLGGAMISRQLATRPDGLADVVRSFTPYLEGPGPMWRLFVTTVQEWADAAPDRADAVADAALTAFVELEAWLAPVLVGTTGTEAGTDTDTEVTTDTLDEVAV